MSEHIKLESDQGTSRIQYVQGHPAFDYGQNDPVWSKGHTIEQLDELLKCLLRFPHQWLKSYFPEDWFANLPDTHPVLIQVFPLLPTPSESFDKDALVAIVEVVRARPVITIYRKWSTDFTERAIHPAFAQENPGFIIRPDDRLGLVHMVMGETQDHIRQSVTSAMLSPVVYMKALQTKINDTAMSYPNQKRIFVVGEANHKLPVEVDDDGMATRLKLNILTPESVRHFTMTVALAVDETAKEHGETEVILQNCCRHVGMLTIPEGGEEGDMDVFEADCTAWPPQPVA